MLGVESKIADAQWNQIYAHSPPHTPTAQPPCLPTQTKGKRQKKNPKEMHKNCSLVMESNAPLPTKPTWYLKQLLVFQYTRLLVPCKAKHHDKPLVGLKH